MVFKKSRKLAKNTIRPIIWSIFGLILIPCSVSLGSANINWKFFNLSKLIRSSSHGIVAKNLSREQIEDLKIGQGTNPIPIEWQQWMRKTRKEAPTAEEILMNEHLKMRTKMRARVRNRKSWAGKRFRFGSDQKNLEPLRKLLKQTESTKTGNKK